jgi:hypothetical protein
MGAMAGDAADVNWRATVASRCEAVATDARARGLKEKKSVGDSLTGLESMMALEVGGDLYTQAGSEVGVQRAEGR